MWREIPSEKLVQAVEDGIIEAGTFPATAGLVAKLWKEKKSKPVEYASPDRIEFRKPSERSETVYRDPYWAEVFNGKYVPRIKPPETGEAF